MEIQTLDAVARFHRALVEEILRSRPSYLSEPFTVAEIYQNLVPYRTHRDRIGVEMNGDYEDALLRLLGGEGEYLTLESEHAVREIRAELATSNPNTGLYRAYAAADVRLNPLRMPRDLPDPSRGPAVGQSTPGLDKLMTESELPEPAEAGPPAKRAGPTAEPGVAPPPMPVMPRAVEPPAKPAPVAKAPAAKAGPEAKAGAKVREPVASNGRGGPASACAWCKGALPQRDVLNFCPSCGGDLHKAPCSNCGEELELEWKFCVVCGTGTDRG